MFIYVTTNLVRNTRVEVVFANDEFVVECCARWRQYRLCDHVNRMPCTESTARWLAYKTVSLYTAHSYRSAAANDNALSVLRPRWSSSYSSTSSPLTLSSCSSSSSNSNANTTSTRILLIYFIPIGTLLQSSPVPLFYYNVIQD